MLFWGHMEGRGKGAQGTVSLSWLTEFRDIVLRTNYREKSWETGLELAYWVGVVNVPQGEPMETQQLIPQHAFIPDLNDQTSVQAICFTAKRKQCIKVKPKCIIIQISWGRLVWTSRSGYFKLHYIALIHLVFYTLFKSTIHIYFNQIKCFHSNMHNEEQMSGQISLVGGMWYWKLRKYWVHYKF